MKTKILLLILLLSTQAFGINKKDNVFFVPSANTLYDLPLEKLMKIKIESPSTLTKTSKQNVPAAITRINKQEIQDSGARNLYELLDIYVPNFQYQRHHFETAPMGVRGIISDRDDNTLIIVNGRVLNERTHYGAIPEKNLVMLDDIQHIEIIRGSGSAIYGYGATSLVINITTESGETFQGTKLTTKLGVIEEFKTIELKFGKQFNKNTSVYLYSGIGHYSGSDQENSPLIFASSFDTQFGEPVISGEPVPYPINNDNTPNRNLLPIKLFANFTYENLNIWARYTRGGQEFAWNLPITDYPSGLSNQVKDYYETYNTLPQPSSGYQQGIIFAKYKHTVNDALSIDLETSYDSTDYERSIVDEASYRQEAYREDEYYARILTNWTPNDGSSLAIGSEFSYEIFGLQNRGLPNSEPLSNRYQDKMPNWTTKTLSFMSEYQWQPVQNWTFFIGARADKNSYTNWLFSPRFASIFTPTSFDTYKFILSRSARIKFAEDLRTESTALGTKANPNFLNSLELRYEKQASQDLFWGNSVYYQHLELTDLTPSTNPVLVSGQSKHWGLETDLTYRTETLTFGISHGYTKLISFHLNNLDYVTKKSSTPYGFGNDLANWSNHLTKLFLHYKLTNNLTINSSLRIYWAYPGSRNYLDYQQKQNLLESDLEDSGKQNLLKPSAFFNLGFSYKHNNQFQINLNGYNLLGIFKRDLNKRFYFNGYGGYRIQAPAVSLSLHYFLNSGSRVDK
jgi:outer membrane receptor for ferrienterochelin and colicins